MSIEVRNLLKEYGEQKAVNNISFKVGKGEIVGFLGQNGAGPNPVRKKGRHSLREMEGEAAEGEVAGAGRRIAGYHRVGQSAGAADVPGGQEGLRATASQANG